MSPAPPVTCYDPAMTRLDTYGQVKPRWRGRLHQYGFYASLLAGTALVVSEARGRGVLPFVVYALSLSALLGCSALYHVPSWGPAARRWLRRLDHAMIFVSIAGTYTPIAALMFREPLRTNVLLVVWLGAAAGVLLKLVWIDAPRWLSVLSYVAVAGVAVGTFPELLSTLGVGGASLIVAGGAVYLIGAVVYALRRPDPAPRVFGFHEIFHAMVLLAASLHFTAISIYVGA